MHRFRKDFASHKTTMRKKPINGAKFFMLSWTKYEKIMYYLRKSQYTINGNRLLKDFLMVLLF